MKFSRTVNGIEHFRLRLGIGATILGLVIYLLGVDPGMFSMDRSPVMGFVQISVMLIGLAFMCLGGYITLNAIWNGSEKSILADIGLRLIATGYLVAVASGMADILGFGNHPFPRIPYFGPLQSMGVIIGEVTIAIGFLMIIPYPRKR